jgi:hypothetical protein
MVDQDSGEDEDGQQQHGGAVVAAAPPDSTGASATNNSAGANKAPTRINSVSPPPSLSAHSGPLIRHLCLFTVVYFVCIVVFFFTRDVRTGLIRLQDILTMLNPLLLVPLFYVIALIDTTNHTISTSTTTDPAAAIPTTMRPMGWQAHLVFLLLTVIYVHGDGYHLAANAIHRYEADLATQTVKDVVYFYDEELGHYYTFTGLMGLHIFWMVRQTQWPFAEPIPGNSGRVALMAFGILHGLVLFITFIEGKFGIPALVFFLVQMVWCIIRRDRLQYDPIIVFTLSYASMGASLLIIWASWQKGFPELTEAGLI